MGRRRLSLMGGKQLLDPRWHWLQSALRKLYVEMDPGAVPVSLTLILIDGEELVSYSIGPDSGDFIDKRIITSPSALTEAALATTVCANVDDAP